MAKKKKLKRLDRLKKILMKEDRGKILSGWRDWGDSGDEDTVSVWTGQSVAIWVAALRQVGTSAPFWDPLYHPASSLEFPTVELSYVTPGWYRATVQGSGTPPNSLCGFMTGLSGFWRVNRTHLSAWSVDIQTFSSYTMATKADAILNNHTLVLMMVPGA